MWTLRQCARCAVRQVTEAREMMIPRASRESRPWRHWKGESDCLSKKRSSAHHHHRPHQHAVCASEILPEQPTEHYHCTAMIIDPSASIPI